jgi:hypothetical protein
MSVTEFFEWAAFFEHKAKEEKTEGVADEHRSRRRNA